MVEESGGPRFCTNCGTQLSQGGIFCSSCGTQVGGPGTSNLNIQPVPGDGVVNVGFSGTGLQALGYGLFYYILSILIIPTGWGVSMLSGWYVSNLTFGDVRTANFTGRGSQIWGYYTLLAVMGLLVVIPIAGVITYWFLSMRIQLAIVRWFFSHIQFSTGQNLRFEGSYWPFVGWVLLYSVSFITIIGWAWVLAAAMRWVCWNVLVEQEHLEFVGNGIDFLWRGIVALLGSLFIITIPWMFVWYIRWITNNILILPGNARRP